MSTGLGWTFENTLSYDFTIKDTHNFNTLIGMSAERGGLGESINGTNEKLIFDSFKYAYLDNAKLIIPGQTTLGGAPMGKDRIDVLLWPYQLRLQRNLYVNRSYAC